jgi:tankyrase
MLIMAGANVSATDYWQFTPLHEAATKLRIDVCSLLLRHGANPYFRNCHGKTAVDSVACHAVRARIIAEYRGYTFLEYVRQGEYSKAKKLLQGPISAIMPTNGRQCTSLSCSAVASGVGVPPDYDLTSALCAAELSCSPPPTSSQSNIPSSNGNSSNTSLLDQSLPIVLSNDESFANGSCTLQSSDPGDGAAALDLVNSNFSPNSSLSASCLPTNAYGETLQGRESHATLPPSGQPSTNAGNLMNAALLSCPSVEVIHFKHVVTGDGALHAIANASASVSPAKRKQMTELLIKKGASVNERNNDYLAPLAIALDNGYFEVAEYLLKNGARVNIADGLGQTCLHRMAIKGNVQAIQVSSIQRHLKWVAHLLS